MRQVSTLQKLLILPLIIVMGVFIAISIPSASTEALSGSQFRAGNIIDDGIFFNKASMSVQQIQNFLNAKVPNCDTWGGKMHSSGQTRAQYGASKGNPAPYTCLRDYVQDTPSKAAENQLCNAYGGGRKTSAQIIYDVAQVCGINPQVLLVLLQKEQSLITDDWPWPVQYRSATGFGCPDTAPCDAEYYGFFNQVYNAGRIYKKYARDAAGYNYKSGRNNNILYNPNRACGSSNVYIQNQATAGLYVYTPYQPNQSALNNLYGTGDGCGAYGNRNFWRMFNDWFGPTHGALIRTESSGTLFYTDGERKFNVPSMEQAAQYGLGLGDVRFVSQQEMNAIPTAGPPFSNSIGRIVKSDNDGDADGGALYLVNNGSRIPIASMDQFSDMGFTGSSIKYLPLSSIERLSLSSKSLSSFIQASDLSVYKVEAGKRKAIFELPKLSQLNPSGNITPLTEFNAYTWDFGPPIVDGDYVIIGPDNGLRLYRDANFYTLPSMGVYDCWKLNGVKTFRTGAYYVTNGTSKGNLGCISEDSSGNAYIMGGTYRYPLSSSQGLTVFKPSDALINRVPVGTLKPVIKNSKGELSVFENNKKRPIPSMAVFAKLGYTSSSIISLPDPAFSAIPTGAKKLSIGTIMRESSGALSVVSGINKRLSIPSMQVFDYYGFAQAPMITVNATDLAAYTSEGNLGYYLKTTTNNVYMVDKRVRYLVDPSLDTHIGINRASMPSVDPGVVGYTLPWQMTRFIKSDNKDAIYYLENGQKRAVPSWQRVIDLGGASKLLILSEYRVSQFSTGSPL